MGMWGSFITILNDFCRCPTRRYKARTTFMPSNPLHGQPMSRSVGVVHRRRGCLQYRSMLGCRRCNSNVRVDFAIATHSSPPLQISTRQLIKAGDMAAARRVYTRGLDRFPERCGAEGEVVGVLLFHWQYLLGAVSEITTPPPLCHLLIPVACSPCNTPPFWRSLVPTRRRT